MRGGRHGGNQGRKINWIAIGLVVVVIVLVVVIVWLASCQGEETATTTTTSQVQIPPGTEMMRITEASNGKTVTVSPGYILILQLTGTRARATSGISSRLIPRW